MGRRPDSTCVESPVEHETTGRLAPAARWRRCTDVKLLSWLDAELLRPSNVAYSYHGPLAAELHPTHEQTETGNSAEQRFGYTSNPTNVRLPDIVLDNPDVGRRRRAICWWSSRLAECRGSVHGDTRSSCRPSTHPSARRTVASLHALMPDDRGGYPLAGELPSRSTPYARCFRMRTPHTTLAAEARCKACE